MKKIIAGVTLLILAPVVWGVTLPTCVNNEDLQFYIDTYTAGCIIDDKLFSDWKYDSAGLLASAIAVTPLNDIPLNPGVKFSASWLVGSDTSLNSSISFLVTVMGGPLPLYIKDASIWQNGTIDGTGIAAVSEELCVPGSSPCVSIGSLATWVDTDVQEKDDMVIFAPTGSVLAIKDISVSGGASGRAHISYVEDRFSQVVVPEPASILLLGTALFGLGAVLRRRIKRQA